MFTSPDLLVLNQREAEQTQSFKDQESMRRWLGGGCHWQKWCYERNTNLSEAINLPYQHPGVCVHDLSMYAHCSLSELMLYIVNCKNIICVYTDSCSHLEYGVHIYREKSNSCPCILFLINIWCFCSGTVMQFMFRILEISLQLWGVEVTPQNVHIFPHRCFSHLFPSHVLLIFTFLSHSPHRLTLPQAPSMTMQLHVDGQNSLFCKGHQHFLTFQRTLNPLLFSTFRPLVFLLYFHCQTPARWWIFPSQSRGASPSSSPTGPHLLYCISHSLCSILLP